MIAKNGLASLHRWNRPRIEWYFGEDLQVVVRQRLARHSILFVAVGEIMRRKDKKRSSLFLNLLPRLDKIYYPSDKVRVTAATA